jgi:hypothetical protein
MIEPWYVDRVTPQKVFIRSFIDPENPPTARSRSAGPCSSGMGGPWREGSATALARPRAACSSPAGRKPTGRRPSAICWGEAKAVLGLEADASEADVRAAYLRLVKQHHPDRPDGDQELFMRVQDAYEEPGQAVSIDAIIDFIRDANLSRTLLGVRSLTGVTRLSTTDSFTEQGEVSPHGREPSKRWGGMGRRWASCSCSSWWRSCSPSGWGPSPATASCAAGARAHLHRLREGG